MKNIPTLTLRLLDVHIPADADTKSLLLNGAKDLARHHQKKFQKKNLSIDLFHNNKIQYSGIQLGRYQGCPEWTAIGKQEVKALKLWFKIFKTENAHLLQNVVIIKERYTPDFLPYQKRYKISPLLVSDKLAKNLNELEDKYARFDHLEKYLYGNIKNFMQHVGYNHDPNQHFLKVTMMDCLPFDRALPVYHQQKKTAFRVRFKCNFRLPQIVRLGQSTALGYGKTLPM